MRMPQPTTPPRRQETHMIGSHHAGTRTRLGVIAIFAGALLAASCTLVGQGNLHVSNDLSGIGADNTTLHAYAPDPGDVWPPAGYVNLQVRGDDFGTPPAYGLNSFLYLVRTSLDCP